MRQANHNIIIYAAALGLLALLYIGFLTNGIPLFWCDFDLLHQAVNLDVSFTRLFYPAPVTSLITRIIYKASGLGIDTFRFFKDTVFLACVLLVSGCVWRISGRRISGILAGIFFMALPSVLKTTMWVCDFELLTQSLLISAFLSYAGFIKKPASLRLILFLVFFFLASQTTNGARFFAPAAALDLLLAKDMAWPRRLALLATLILIAVSGTGLPLNTAHYSFTLVNLKEQLPYLIRTDSYIAGITFILSLFFAWRLKDRLLRLACFWFWGALISQLFYKRTDFQFAYQVMLLVPLTIILFSGPVLFFGQLTKKTSLLLGSISALMIGSIIFNNLMLSNHYRGAWGSLFIAMGKVNDYMDKHSQGALIAYQSVTPDFQSIRNKNRYLNMEGIATTEELEARLQGEAETGNYENIYLISHMPDALKAIDKIREKRLIAVLEGKNRYLYDRLKEIYRLKTKSPDTPNQFIVYLYDK